MALGGMGLFLLEAAFGISLLLLFFPPAVLGKGFFALHGVLAVALAIGALLASPPGYPFATGAASVVILGIYTVLAQAGASFKARPLLALGAGLCAAVLVPVALKAPRPEGSAWIVAGAVLGGLFLASAVLAMNLGHWYLISRSLPFRLLSRGAALFGMLAGARTLLLATAAAVPSNRAALEPLLSPEREGLFFLFRVLWGVVGPLALAWFIWKTAEMRSNQAATGLLYVAVVFVLIGELLSSYLTVATGFPA